MTATLASGLDYAVIDADNHYYESPDCFSRHIEAKYRDKAITAASERRRRQVEREDRLGRRTRSSSPKFDRTNPPGSLLTILRAKDTDPNFKWSDSYSTENMLAGVPGQEAAPGDDGRAGHRGHDDVPLVRRVGRAPDDPTMPTRCTRTSGRSTAGSRRSGATAPTDASSPRRCCRCSTSTARSRSSTGCSRPAPRSSPSRRARSGNDTSPADPVYDPFWARIERSRHGAGAPPRRLPLPRDLGAVGRTRGPADP